MTHPVSFQNPPDKKGEKIKGDFSSPRTRKKYSAEEKIRIVLDGLRGDETIAELCRREGISSGMYYKWSKEFLEAGKQRLVGNSRRQADSDEVQELRRQNEQYKQLVAELSLKNRVLKKSSLGWDDRLGD